MEDNPQNVSNRFYPLPCMFTLASSFCGFYAIIAAINSEFKTAAIAILIAAIFDGLDGRVARMTGTTSNFGVQLDSLCDMISFGVAPGVLAYLWALHPYGRYGWLAAFLYVAMTSLRLARFNSQDAASESKNFVGLPCPAAAAMISASILFCNFIGIAGEVKHISLLFLVYLLSYLMVSTHTYYSFKEISTVKINRFQMLIGFILLFVLIAAEPQIMIFSLFLIYLISGPTYAIVKKVKSMKKPTLPLRNQDH